MLSASGANLLSMVVCTPCATQQGMMMSADMYPPENYLCMLQRRLQHDIMHTPYSGTSSCINQAKTARTLQTNDVLAGPEPLCVQS